MHEHTIKFTDTNRGKWIRQIVDARNDMDYIDIVYLDFTEISSVESIEAVHIVSLACLIEFFIKQGKRVRLLGTKTPVVKFLLEKLKFKQYWAGKKNYVETEEESIFNLWRVIENEKEAHSQHVHDYLKRRFFRHKDLSAVKNSLDEAYYNIFDHAKADGVAFSCIRFYPDNEKLTVAVCDFGIGIATKVKMYRKDMSLHDTDALRLAMQDRFTTKSQIHNQGLGLGNIRAACTENDALRILSNSALLLAKKDIIETYKNNFNFTGTLIYYELSLSHFEDEEIIDNFTW